MKGNGKKGKYPPRVAGMWINSYNDKKTGREKKFYKLSVSRAEMIKLIKATDEDYIALVGFKNSNKEEDKHPDVQFQKSEDRKGGKKGGGKKHRDDDEDEEDETDEEEETDNDESEDEESDDDSEELPF